MKENVESFRRGILVSNSKQRERNWGIMCSFRIRSTTIKKRKQERETEWRTTMIRKVAIFLLSTFRLTHTQISSTNQRAYMKFARWKKRNTYISHVRWWMNRERECRIHHHFSNGSQCDGIFLALGKSRDKDPYGSLWTNNIFVPFIRCKREWYCCEIDSRSQIVRVIRKGRRNVLASMSFRESFVKMDQVVVQAKHDKQCVSTHFLGRSRAENHRTNSQELCKLADNTSTIASSFFASCKHVSSGRRCLLRTRDTDRQRR